MSVICPDRHTGLESQGGTVHYEGRKKDIPLEARCLECRQPLRILKACGAVDYFCQNGHSLISKKYVEFMPI